MPKLNSLVTQNQLVDSLTAHISLYHSNSLPLNPNYNPNQRSSVLKWFSSLTVHQRQAHLTTVDFKFVQLLIQMLGKLRTQGYGRFIILPDLPSRDLPSLCFKKSRGLLSRVAESNESERLIFEAARLFGSREGENIEECSCSIKCLDSLTVSEDLIGNVDKFVETMDRVSNGGFLRGEESELGCDWVELEWLKAKGYYSIEAFVANRLEVALRLAWLNCGNGKKRGVKLKEKVSAAAAAANVFLRKKGCVDWWLNLDAETRRKFFTVVLGKAAKSLACEILKGASTVLEDEKWLFRAGAEQPLRYIHAESMRQSTLKLSADAEFGSPIKCDSESGKATPFGRLFNRLFVVQDIVALILSGQHREYNVSKIFFSTLSSVNSISDCILRKIRGLVMVILLDCTRLELLGEGDMKLLTNKQKEKPSPISRRKKGKTHNMKKPNPAPDTAVHESSVKKPLKDLEYSLAHSEKIDSKEFKTPGIPHGKEIQGDISSSAVEMECSSGLVLGNGRTAARKNRKGRNKNKNRNSSLNNSVDLRNSERSVEEAPCLSVITSDEAAKLGRAFDIQNVSNVDIVNSATLAVNISFSGSAVEPCKERIDTQSVREDYVVGCSGGICYLGLEHKQFSNGLIENSTVPSRAESASIKMHNNVTSHVLDTVSSNEDINFNNEEAKEKSNSFSNQLGAFNVKEESTARKGQENKNFNAARSINASEYISYEWPSLAPVYFPSITSHLLPAADRLHLDVGHNWHNHIRQPFIPTVHQARNSPIESGYNQTLSRPLAMSLDWPPMVRSISGLAPSVTCNYDSGFISRRNSALHQSFAAHNMQFTAKTIDDERRYSGDFVDTHESASAQELVEEYESHCISEEELEMHAVSGIDYNQYFGGGVMYWNSSDHPGTGFSRPPSLSSDDSTWAWHEADMNRAVDDMVAFSSSYSTNGLTSPTAASFCSPFDALSPGHQALGYVVSGNEVPGKVLQATSAVADTGTKEEVTGSLTNLSGDVEGKAGDSLPYPILPPIIIPTISREKKRNHDIKSPCVPPSRREHPQIKRPPSPVVLCVPRAPRPPPPSPVSESRKHRGFPTVRSGSSSPRHWSMRGWHHEGTNTEEACLRMDGTEVVWPSWRNKNLSTHPMIQPLPVLQDRLIAMSQLARDQEHPDVSFPLQPPEFQNNSAQKASLSLMHSLLHDEIDFFCKQVATANMDRKPFINWAVKRVTRSLQVLWPRSRTNIFGSIATGLSLPTSDVDLVVCLPPVRNLEPIKEAGILEGRNGIKETCLQHAARYLANQEWVKNDSLKTVENTAIPIIMLVVEVPNDLITSVASNIQSPKDELTHIAEHENHVNSEVVASEESSSPKCPQVSCDNMKDARAVRLDISFKSPSHTGLQTTELVKALTEQFPAATPLALVLKQFLADRSLDQSYSGGLSSYCLVLLIARFLQHEHHLGRPINQNWGSLLMDFLYFFGNVFDPRHMRISVQGSGVYINRERGYSIDPLHIDDPLYPTNNVGRNCFRIHQCIKAFSEAHSILENELMFLTDEADACSKSPYRLLPKIIPSINSLLGI